jgi:arabinofuranan 3-O-arabinosyltransferase
VRDQQDGERGWARAIAPPAARAWRVDAWASVAPETPDHLLDRWMGTGAATAFDGSSRFEGLGRNRASSAFDRDPRRAWIAGWIRSRGAWLQWRTREPQTIRTLRLERAPVRVRFPTRVRVIADGLPTAPLAVAADGTVALPVPLRARTVRIAVLDAAFPPGTPGSVAQRRAVGVGEVTGDGVPRAAVRRAGALRLPCGGGPTLHLGARAVRLRVAATPAAIDAGRPLHVVGCGAPTALPAAPVTIRADAAPWRLDHVRLSSPASERTAVAGGGRVVDPGRDGRGKRDGVRVAVDGPSWLVLGESYNAGWRARCDGRSLGRPVALQGYANAWPVERGCRDVSFAFVPNRALIAADVISLVACLALLALLVLRRPRAGPASLAPLPDAPARAWPLRRAVAAGVAAGLVLAFVFALRAGAVLGPLTFLVLWRGVPARTLALAAGAVLLVALPVLHLAVDLPDEGFDTNYAAARIAEHWLAVGAVWALGMALWRTLSVRAERLNTATDRAAAAPRSAP